ncbi:MAG TPA: serine hydrolase domain-containing protein, partial [Longimicrobiaceae bacterium]
MAEDRDYGTVTRREFLRASASGLLGASLFDARRHLMAQERTGNADPEVIAALRRSIPRLMERRDVPGLSIALVEGGRILWSEGFGHTDRSRAVAVTADTPFFVGSISKSFTALGV